MALILNSSFISLTLSMALLFSLYYFLPHANATSSEISTNVLDVTAALHQAHQVLSFKPKTLQHKEEEETQATLSSSSSSSFSLPLHPRDSLFNAKHKDYRSLVLTRLKGDSVRVSWILSKLHHHNKSELRPEYLSAPVTSGLSKGSGQYFTRIGVGQPAQPFYMILDTAVDMSWLQCKPCYHCYNQSDPVFDPTTSSSYSLVPCEAKSCKVLEGASCIDNQCEYQLLYVYGSSYSQGVLVTETMSFGNTGSINRVPMGCGHRNGGLFVGAAGTLGMGHGPLSFPSHINVSSFSYCLVHRDTNKSSTLEFNSPPPGDSVKAPLLMKSKIDTYYYVEFIGVSVGGRKVPVPPSTFKIDQSGGGGIIVDSGITITRLQLDAYHAVRDAFVALTRDLPRAGAFSLFDTCYNLSSVEKLTVPTMSFEMSDGRSWMLPVSGYLIPVDNKGTFCFAFARSMGSLSILGNVQQQGTRVHFDLANSVFSFSTKNCG